MKFNRELIRNWFGFTRRERTSSFILLLLILLVLMLRYSLPQQNIEVEDISAIFSSEEFSTQAENSGLYTTKRLFLFDPNTASYDTLIMLGLGQSEARVLISYRSKGGRFRQSSDIKKIYGLDENKAEELIPYVDIEENNHISVDNLILGQQSPLLDLNRCDSAALVALPGIGPVLSARIIKFRLLLGGYSKVDQLKEVYGLPGDTYEIIKGRFVIDTTLIRRISVNSADFRALSGLVYLERYDVVAILKYRELNRVIKSIEDLVVNKILTEDKAVKIGPYLKFD